MGVREHIQRRKRGRLIFEKRGWKRMGSSPPPSGHTPSNTQVKNGWGVYREGERRTSKSGAVKEREEKLNNSIVGESAQGKDGEIERERERQKAMTEMYILHRETGSKMSLCLAW